MDHAWLEMVHVCTLDQLERSQGSSTAPPAIPLYPCVSRVTARGTPGRSPEKPERGGRGTSSLMCSLRFTGVNDSVGRQLGVLASLLKEDLSFCV